jgi:CheY-like chemotaxis protein
MKRLCILVVEDDAVIAFLIGEILKGMGHEICAKEDTEAGAVATALRCRPDLMIVDEHLRQGSGLAAVEQVLRRWPIPFILVSGDTRRIRRLMPHAVFMEKPFHETDLARSIRRAMGCEGAAAVPGPPCSDMDSFRSLSPTRALCPDP